MMRPPRQESQPSVSTSLLCTEDGRHHSAQVRRLFNSRCWIEAPQCAAKSGDRPVLRPSPLLALPATVRWSKSGRIGVQFANPMIAAMLREYINASQSGVVHAPKSLNAKPS